MTSNCVVILTVEDRKESTTSQKKARK